jgi:hypothetical protein
VSTTAQSRTEMAATVLASLPEIDLIQDKRIRDGTVEAFVLGWELGGWDEWEQGAYWFSWVRKDGVAIEFVRSTTRMALAIADVMAEVSDVELNRDHLASGALLRDVGKLLEKAPAGQGDLTTSLIRHPFSGVHLALRAGLPHEVVHIVATHGPEGGYARRSAEATIVAYVEKLAADPILRREMDLTIDQYIPTLTLLHTPVWDHLLESWGGWLGPRDERS